MQYITSYIKDAVRACNLLEKTTSGATNTGKLQLYWLNDLAHCGL